jgi:hypothetical protein
MPRSLLRGAPPQIDLIKVLLIIHLFSFREGLSFSVASRVKKPIISGFAGVKIYDPLEDMAFLRILKPS